MRQEHWRKAMEKEMDALLKNNIWEKCVLPEGKRPVGCRWIFTIKRPADGTIERYKARLVAKGYTRNFFARCKNEHSANLVICRS